MNKYFKFGVPLSVGVVAAAVPIGYVSYVATHPTTKDDNAMVNYWGKFDERLLASYSINHTQAAQDAIAEGASALLSHDKNSPEVDQAVQHFRDVITFSPKFENAFNKYPVFNEASLSLNISGNDINSYKISENESDEMSPVFGKGFNTTVYDLFDKVIPRYIAMNKLEIIDTPLDPSIFLPEDLSYEEFGHKYTGGNANENTDIMGADSSRYFYIKNYIKPGETMMHDYYIRSQYFPNERTFSWFYSLDGTSTLNPFSMDEAKYNTVVNDQVTRYKEQPKIASLVKQYEWFHGQDSVFAKNKVIYGDFINDIFPTNIHKMPAEDILDVYNKAIGKTKTGDIWSTMPVGQGSPIYEIMNFDFDDIFDNFTSSSDILNVRISDIPALMGMGENQKFTFEYAVANGAKYPNGNLVLPDDFLGEERYNTFYLRGQVPAYTHADLANRLTRDEILEIFDGGEW